MTRIPGTWLVPEMITAWAKATPDAIAAVADDRTLTYRQLLHGAWRVAHAVRRAGAGRDEVVGLATGRGLDGLTGMLGIMLAGSAYLYLDPTWPAERLDHMARECRLRLILVGRTGWGGGVTSGTGWGGGVTSGTGWGGGVTSRDGSDLGAIDPLLLRLPIHTSPTGGSSRAAGANADEPGRAAPAGGTAAKPEPADAAAVAMGRPGRAGVRARDLCYVVYTSGSTGVPKGVAVEHGGVANMARRLAVAFRVTAGVRVLQFASWAWDAAACEILMTLGAGGTLVLAGESARHGGEALAQLLRGQRVAVATLTPSLLAALPEAELPRLRIVVAVGERCPPELVERWAPGRTFLNGYGPSEATVAVSVGRCRPGEPVTIGPPLPGVLVRIIAENDRPAAPGQPGELVVGGAGVARGYLTEPPEGYRGRSPVITAGTRFFMAAGQRWYRTGDLAYQRPDDGCLIYQGRVDDQVKVRGHRVELVEVEQSLRRHPGVQACAVAAGGGRLVAYVVPGAPALSTDEVLSEAARWLPDFMLPNEVRVVDMLPLTGNGKLNRSALTAMAGTALTGTPMTNAAMTGTPMANAAMVGVGRQLGAEVSGGDVLADTLALVRLALETEQVGPDDDVFDAGGHSLVAAQLAVAATERFRVPVTALQVVDHPTAARLAALISELGPPGTAA